MWRKLRCEWMLSTNHFQNYPRRTSANILCKLNRWGLCLFVWTKQLQENWFFKNVLYPNNCLKEHHEQVISQAFNLFKCTITKELFLIYVVFFLFFLFYLIVFETFSVLDQSFLSEKYLNASWIKSFIRCEACQAFQLADSHIST